MLIGGSLLKITAVFINVSIKISKCESMENTSNDNILKIAQISPGMLHAVLADFCLWFFSTLGFESQSHYHNSGFGIRRKRAVSQTGITGYMRKCNFQKQPGAPKLFWQNNNNLINNNIIALVFNIRIGPINPPNI